MTRHIQCPGPHGSMSLIYTCNKWEEITFFALFTSQMHCRHTHRHSDSKTPARWPGHLWSFFSKTFQCYTITSPPKFKFMGSALKFRVKTKINNIKPDPQTEQFTQRCSPKRGFRLAPKIDTISLKADLPKVRTQSTFPCDVAKNTILAQLAFWLALNGMICTLSANRKLCLLRVGMFYLDGWISLMIKVKWRFAWPMCTRR